MPMDTISLLKRLEKPSGPVDAVIDTDTYNEIDDQFALSYLIKSEGRVNLKAIYAAPFSNSRSQGPRDGMEKSYLEILHLLSLMGRRDLETLVYKGSERYLPSETEPVRSPAAEHLAGLAMAYTPENPLYIVAIGAITNVASALLIAPEIRDRVVLIWLGGQAYHWPDNEEFNLMQDVAAARIVFGCGMALVQLPCMGVVSSFTVSGVELAHWLRGKNSLCDYLADYTTNQALEDGGNCCWTRVIWDVTAVAWLLGGDFMRDRLEHSPIPEYDHHYAFDPTRHFIRYVYHIDRDRLFEDLIKTLSR